jgi:hypothetical protein
LQAALLATTTGRVSTDPVLAQCIRAAGRVPAQQRLEAYRANIRAAHLQALDRAYPVTREVLGQRYWRQMLEHELPGYGSASPDLDGYGEFLPGLLGKVQSGRDELAEFPYLEELAGLEWAVHCAAHARDDHEFDWTEFEMLADDGHSAGRLVPSSALTILELCYPVDEIWRSHTGAAIRDTRAPGTIACCVHRNGRFGVTVSRLERDDHALLEQLSSTRIGDLLDSRDEARTAAIAQRIFDWISRGWIVGFELDRP